MTLPTGYVENGYCNVCLVPDRAEKSRLEALLWQNGIGFGNIYPGAMSEQTGARPHLKGHFGGDAAQRLCRSVTNLPLFAYMRPEELDHVLATVRKWSQ